jgi:hypothetical protein
MNFKDSINQNQRTHHIQDLSFLQYFTFSRFVTHRKDCNQVHLETVICFFERFLIYCYFWTECCFLNGYCF